MDFEKLNSYFAFKIQEVFRGTAAVKLLKPLERGIWKYWKT